MLIYQRFENRLRMMVQPVQRFVQQPDRAIGVDQAGKGRALFLPCREISNRNVQQRRELEQVTRASHIGIAIQSLPKGQGLAQRQIGVECQPFIDQAPSAVMLYIPCIGTEQAGKNTDQAGFADAVRPRNVHSIASDAVYRQLAKKQSFAPTAGNVLCGEASLHGRER